MKILIYPKHHDPLDQAIAFITHGKGSHAAFLRADGRRIHEAFFPEVRDRLVLPGDMARAEVYAIEGLSEEQHRRFEALFDANLHRHIKYSIGDLFRYLLNRPDRDEHHTFCSRYVMHCCRRVLHPVQMPLVRLPDNDWASPRDLRISPRLHLLPDFWRGK
jgi:hypothetical protein